MGSGIGGLSLKYTNFLSNNRHLFLILFTALSLITFLLLFKTYIIWEFPSAVINLLFACLIFSQGFLMGNFFPFVIFKINQHKKLVSAAWISTAIFTTIGGHFSILFALKYGFTAVYLLGFFGYIVAFFLTKKLNAFASI